MDPISAFIPPIISIIFKCLNFIKDIIIILWTLKLLPKSIFLTILPYFNFKCCDFTPNYKDNDIILKVVECNYKEFKNIQLELKDDKEFVLENIKRKGIILKYVSKRLKMDYDIVFRAIQSDFTALKYSLLIDDKDFILKAVKQNGFCLSLVSERLQMDKDVILNAVKQTSMIYSCLNPFYWDDRDIWLAANKQWDIELERIGNLANINFNYL
jgi:hypothetical protein